LAVVFGYGIPPATGQRLRVASALLTMKQRASEQGKEQKVQNPGQGGLACRGIRTQLLDGSPAIDPLDAGVSAACVDDLGHPLTRDQRGSLRPWGAQ
jgi:hypothetical protein